MRRSRVRADWIACATFAIAAGCATASAKGAATSGAADAAGDAAADAQTGDVTADAAADGGSDAAADAADAEISATDAATDAPALLCKAAAVTCSDNQILDLGLIKKASARAITNTTDSAVFESEVDASAGGFQPTESFVYARFTSVGLERVDIGDHAALESMAWDIAFRRYIVRLNSGPSGPSCVVGAPLAEGVTFDQVVAAARSITLGPEAYYDKACKLVDDGSGLGAPATVLSPYWKYTGCVQMTGQVFQVKLADGRLIKLTFSSFYPPAAQATCDSTGAVPTGTAAAKIRLKWAVLAGP